MFLHPDIDIHRLPADLTGSTGSAPPGAAAGPPPDAEWLAALVAAVAEAARALPGLDVPPGTPAGAAGAGAAHGTRRGSLAGGQADGWADGAGACLLRTGVVEVRLVRWAAGQGTRAHDHGGAVSALALVDGELVEDSFEPPLWRAAGVRRRLAAGTVATLGPEHAHVLANPGPGPAASVHAVSPPSLAARYRSVAAASFLAELCPHP